MRTGQSQGAQRVTQTGSRVGAAPQSAQMHAIGSYFAQLGHRHEVAKTGTAKGPPTPHSSATAHGSDAVRHQLSRSGVDADQRRTKQPPFLTLGCPPAVGWAPCLCLPLHHHSPSLSAQTRRHPEFLTGVVSESQTSSIHRSFTSGFSLSCPLPTAQHGPRPRSDADNNGNVCPADCHGRRAWRRAWRRTWRTWRTRVQDLCELVPSPCCRRTAMLTPPQMLWNWNTIDSCFLASTWKITSTSVFAGSCIGVVLLVMSLEMLRRAVKEYDRFLIRKHAASQVVATKPPKGASDEGSPSPACAPVASKGYRPTIFEQAVRALLHMMQFAVAYFVMLYVSPRLRASRPGTVRWDC